MFKLKVIYNELDSQGNPEEEIYNMSRPHALSAASSISILARVKRVEVTGQRVNDVTIKYENGERVP